MDGDEAGWKTARLKKRPQERRRNPDQAPLNRTELVRDVTLQFNERRSGVEDASHSTGRGRGHPSNKKKWNERKLQEASYQASDPCTRQAGPVRPGKQAREDARKALLAEARKSKQDVFTGRWHCLSCGKAFSTLDSLAEHLKKHDGVNSDDYKILHYERQRAKGAVAPRPSRTGFTTKDLFEAAFAKSRPKKELGADSGKASRQRRAQKSETLVASTVPARSVVKVPRTKMNTDKSDGLQGIKEEERLRLESAFQGLKLKRTKRLTRNTKRVTAVKKFVLLERVAAAQRMVEKAAGRIQDFELQKCTSSTGRVLDETEMIKQEAESAALHAALSKAEERLREAKAFMQKKVTARQHIMNLLCVSLRNDASNEGLSEVDCLEYDHRAASEVLALFDELDALDASKDDDHPDNNEKASCSPTAPPSNGDCPSEEQPRHRAKSPQTAEANHPGTPSTSTSSVSDFESPPDLLSAWASCAGLNQHFAEFLNMEPSSITIDASSGAHSTSSKKSGHPGSVPGCSGGREQLEGLIGDENDMSCSDSELTSSLDEMENNVLADWACAAGSGGADFQSLLFDQEERSPPQNSLVMSISGSGCACTTDERGRDGVAERISQPCSPRDGSSYHLGADLKLKLAGEGVDKLDDKSIGQGCTQRVAPGNVKESSNGVSMDVPTTHSEPALHKAKTVRSYAAVLTGDADKALPPDRGKPVDGANADTRHNPGEGNIRKKKRGKKNKKKKSMGNGDLPLPPGGDGSHQGASFACDVCGISCATCNDLQEHLKGKSHVSKAARDAVVSMVEHPDDGALTVSSTPTTIREVDDAVVALLTRLNELQHNSLVRHNDERSKAHRWLTNGTKEVTRALTKGKLKALILAPNIEQPLDEAISKITEGVSSHGVLAVYALNRKKLGRIFHFRKKMSTVGVLDLNGVQPLFEHLKELVESNPQIRVGV